MQEDSKWKRRQNSEDLEREDGQVRLDPERALEVCDRCLLLLLVFKRVVYTDY